MARPKNRADNIPDMRGGLKRFVKMQEQKGKPWSAMWEELYTQEGPKAFFDMVIKCHPREMLIEQDITQTVQLDAGALSADVLAQAIAARRELDDRSSDTGPDQPVH